MSKYPKPPFKARVIDPGMTDLELNGKYIVLKLRPTGIPNIPWFFDTDRGDGYYCTRFKVESFKEYYEQLERYISS